MFYLNIFIIMYLLFKDAVLNSKIIGLILFGVHSSECRVVIFIKATFLLHNISSHVTPHSQF
jgi:hypothetical protein